MEGAQPHLSAGEHLEPLSRALPTFPSWLSPVSPPPPSCPEEDLTTPYLRKAPTPPGHEDADTAIIAGEPCSRPNPRTKYCNSHKTAFPTFFQLSGEQGNTSAKKKQNNNQFFINLEAQNHNLLPPWCPRWKSLPIFAFAKLATSSQEAVCF